MHKDCIYTVILLSVFPIVRKNKYPIVALSILMNLLAKEYMQKKMCEVQTLCSCTLEHARTGDCISASALQSKRREGPYLGKTETGDFFKGTAEPKK